MQIFTAIASASVWWTAMFAQVPAPVPPAPVPPAPNAPQPGLDRSTLVPPDSFRPDFNRPDLNRRGSDDLIRLSPVERSHLIAQWLLSLGLLTGGLALAYGVYRYNRNETWYRIDFLRKAVKQFEQNPKIWKALKILDFEDYRDYEIRYQNKTISFQVNNEMLCRALASHEDRTAYRKELDELRRQNSPDLQEKFKAYLIETEVRDWFNTMLNGLEHFGYFIESEMFTAKEIEPWMIYWIRLIADRKYKRPGASKFYDQLYTYIHAYSFSGVINLFETFGYRILPTPYREKDFERLRVRTEVESQKDELDINDLQTALSLAKASYLIYQDMSYVEEIAARWKIINSEGNITGTSLKYFDNPERTKNTDTQAFMFKTDKFIVLAFRGSQEPKDWRTNFSTRLRRFVKTAALEKFKYDRSLPIGRVHRGFQAGWESVELEVIDQLLRWQGLESPIDTEDQRLALWINQRLKGDLDSDLPLFITGHSLGGALATVAAVSLINLKFKVAGLYTFGQPRVGDLVFASDAEAQKLPGLQGRIFRFVNNNDIVPHVPLPYLLWNPFRFYKHVGKMLYFNASGKLVKHPNMLFRSVDFIFGLLRALSEPGIDLVNDHRLEFYISNLEKAIEVERVQAKMNNSSNSKS